MSTSYNAPKLLHSLLDDALLGIEDGQGQRTAVTLPGLLARLSRAESTELTTLQAHQQHAWHAFTVQLAALALARAKRDTAPKDESSWRDLLLRSAVKDGAGPEAFTLVVNDLAKAAFMQPPVPEGNLVALKNDHTAPTGKLDVLITSKNHDVKMERLSDPTPEHWIFGLVTLQTMQGFLGTGNYGIARMNGGFASRPCVGYAPEQTMPARFERDLRVLLAARARLLDNRGFGEKATLGLVWCAPWDGTTSLAFAALDPFFIEICRRIRLSAVRDEIVAHRGSSRVARIDGGQTTGNTGDIWTPVAGKDGKALTMSENGFTYERVQDLMFGDWHSAAGETGTTTDRYWVGQVLVRGQGKTGGYHERWVPVPGKARSFLANPDARVRLGKRAQEWVGFAKVARLNILKPAILNLLQSGPEKLKFDDDRAEPFLAHLNVEIDGIFFPLLFELAGTDPEAANVGFAQRLIELAKRELELATTSVPISSARRYRAIAYAFRAFWGAARNRKDFPRTTHQAKAHKTCWPSKEEQSERS